MPPTQLSKEISDLSLSVPNLLSQESQKSNQDGRYTYCYALFDSGSLAGTRWRLSDYTGSSHTFHINWPNYNLPTPPKKDDTFRIIPGPDASYSGYGLAFSGGIGAAPDLNLLIAPLYAWVYKQTNNPVYRDQHDEIFAGSIVRTGIGSQKVYNQNYRWSGLPWLKQSSDRVFPLTVEINIDDNGNLTFTSK